MKFLIASVLITLTMPLLDEEGNFLPLDQKLAVVIWKANTLQPVAADVAYAGQDVAINVPGDYGTWFAVAWRMDPTTQLPVVSSIPSEYATKVERPVCGTYCHQVRGLQ